MTEKEEKLVNEIENQLKTVEVGFTDYDEGLDGYGDKYQIYTGLRYKFPNSFFLPDIYDEGICGVDCITESIIYDFTNSGYYLVLRHENTFGDLGDRMYGGDRIMSMIEKLTPEILQGKVKPTIGLFYGDMKEWNVMESGTCSFRPEINTPGDHLHCF